MEMSVSIDRKISDRIMIFISSAFIGLGAFWSIITIFSLSYSIHDFYKGNLVGGFVKTWNDIASALGNSDYILISKYTGASENGQLFLTVMFLVFLIIAYLIVRSEILGLNLVLLMPILLISLFSKLVPSNMAVILYVSGIILMSLRKITGQVLGKIVFIALIMLVTMSLSKVTYLSNSFAKETSAYVKENIEKARYGNNSLGEGTFHRTINAKTEGDALTVTMEKPQSMYLRGFVGEEYVGDNWKALSAEEHYENLPLLNTINLNNFNGLGQLTEAGKASGMSYEKETINIEVKDASTHYVYIPYEISQSELEAGKNWSNSFLTGKGITGGQEYEYEYEVTTNLTGKWTEIAGKLFQENYISQLEEYKRLESYINVEAYTDYTALSDEEGKIINSYLGSRGNQEKGHIEYKTAISLIKDYLDENMTYEEVSQDEEGGILREFFSSGKGDDTRYATAATLMFRYYGIPARYVEGYLITKEDASNMKAHEPYDIHLSNAHAWTEIYVDGVGWVPIETCKAYYGVMEDADLSKGLENKSSVNPFDMDENISPSQGDEGEALDKENTALMKLIIGIIAGIITIVVILLLISYIVKRILKTIREKKDFKNADVKIAVAAMYSYCIRHDLPIENHIIKLGQEAMYSNHAFSDDLARKEMHKAIKAGKRDKKKHE